MENRPLTREELKDMIKNNKNITEVNTSEITDMSYLFKDNKSFNQDISGWDTSKVTNMSYMFYNASSFNKDISNWDISKVINLDYCFYGAYNLIMTDINILFKKLNRNNRVSLYKTLVEQGAGSNKKQSYKGLSKHLNLSFIEKINLFYDNKYNFMYATSLYIKLFIR